MSNANPTIWQPIGPAPIQNPFYGSLNYASPQGSGQAAGAMHGLAVAQGGPGRARAGCLALCRLGERGGLGPALRQRQ